MARVSREHARAEMDRRSRARTGPGERNADRLDASLRRFRLARAGCVEGPVRAAAGSRSGTVAPRSHSARGALHRAARQPAARDDLRTRAVDLPPVTVTRTPARRILS